MERRLSPALVESYKREDKKQALIDTCAAFGELDLLAEVVEEAHRLAIEILLWITLSDEGALAWRKTR